ncbi:MAG: inositol monophosphatase [bacterium]|nr:inositol monophosphatase [bacterium]
MKGMNEVNTDAASPFWTESLHVRLLAGIRRIGEFQLEHFGVITPEEMDAKSSHSDLVSWVDRESESRLAELLTELLPEAGQIGEEGLDRQASGDLRWIIDPLDGTTNYAYGHPFFCISVGLVRGDEPVLGVIHAPRLDECFHGYSGYGARVSLAGGERPIHVSRRDDPLRTLHATGFADRRKVRATVNLRNLERILHATHGVRRAGSAALDLAFTAAGRLDGFWEMNLNPWDVAAGIFLVREAGGRVTDFRGLPDALSGRAIVASNGLVHDWLLEQLELDPLFDR